MAAGEGPVDPVDQQRAVGQPGERVVHHLVGQAGTQGHDLVVARGGQPVGAIGDAPSGDDDAAHVGVVEQVHARELDGLPPAVGPSGTELAGLGEPGGVDHPPQHPVGPLEVVGVGEVEGAALVPELGWVTQDLLHLAAAVEQVPRAVQHHHGVSHLV